VQIGGDIENILRHMILLTQKRDYRRLTHQNLIAYEILQHVIVPQEYHNFMSLDKNAFVFSWMLSNLEFTLEIERLLSRNELSLEYIKSIKHVLLWLIKLFDIKWRQLHDDFDYISRLHLKRLLNLQRQIEFVLENLVADNQQHRKSKDDKYILEDRSDILNTEKFKVEGAILIDKNKANLFETNKTEITTNKSSEIPNDRITFETILNHAELLKHVKNNNSTSITSTDQKFNTPTNVKDKSISNSTFLSKIKTLRDNDLSLKNETASKSKKFTDNRYDKHMKDHRKRFDQLKNVFSISSNKNSTSTLQETDQSKRVGTNVTLHASLENVTDILKPWSRRTLQILVHPNKNEEQKNKSPSIGHVSTRKTSDKHHYFNEGTKIRSDSASAIDEILEAVDGVLPTDKSVELSAKKGPNTISRIF